MSSPNGLGILISSHSSANTSHVKRENKTYNLSSSEPPRTANLPKIDSASNTFHHTAAEAADAANSVSTDIGSESSESSNINNRSVLFGASAPLKRSPASHISGPVLNSALTSSSSVSMDLVNLHQPLLEGKNKTSIAQRSIVPSSAFPQTCSGVVPHPLVVVAPKGNEQTLAADVPTVKSNTGVAPKTYKKTASFLATVGGFFAIGGSLKLAGIAIGALSIIFPPAGVFLIALVIVCGTVALAASVYINYARQKVNNASSTSNLLDRLDGTPKFFSRPGLDDEQSGIQQNLEQVNTVNTIDGSEQVGQIDVNHLVKGLSENAGIEKLTNPDLLKSIPILTDPLKTYGYDTKMLPFYMAVRDNFPLFNHDWTRAKYPRNLKSQLTTKVSRICLNKPMILKIVESILERTLKKDKLSEKDIKNILTKIGLKKGDLKPNISIEDGKGSMDALIKSILNWYLMSLEVIGSATSPAKDEIGQDLGITQLDHYEKQVKSFYKSLGLSQNPETYIIDDNGKLNPIVGAAIIKWKKENPLSS